MKNKKNILASFVVTGSLVVSGAALSYSAVTPSAYEVSLDQVPSPMMATLSDGTAVIDLVAFYQPIYAVLMGEEAVHARIAYKVGIANEAFANSEVNAYINLVAVTPTFNIPDDLGFSEEITFNGHSVGGAQGLFSILTLNNAPGHHENDFYASYSGDLAAYFRPYRPLLDSSTRGGTASQGGEISAIFDRFADNSNIQYQDTTLAHELGHNLGAGHEDGVDSFSKDSDANAYSCGGKNTVMWSTTITNTDGGKQQVFSNPNIQIEGDYCGEIGHADNAAVINRNAASASARRERASILGEVRIKEDKITVNESEGQFVVTLVRTGDLSEEAAVGVLINSDTASTIYNLKEAYQFATFKSGESSTTATFGVVNDAIEQGDMVATIKLVYPKRLKIEDGVSALTIIDSPAGNPGAISFEAPKRVEPGHAINFELVRTGGFDGELVVHLRTQSAFGQTVPYELFYPLNENVIFKDGQERISFEIPVDVIDNLDSDRAFTLSAEVPALDVAAASTIVVIDAGVVAYDVDSVEVSNNASFVEVDVTRSGDTTKRTSVYVSTLDGSLDSSEHYVPLGQWVEFRSGETTKSVSIQLRSSNQTGSFFVELDYFGVKASVNLTEPALEEDSERQAAFIHPLWVLFMLVFTVVRVRSVHRNN